MEVVLRAHPVGGESHIQRNATTKRLQHIHSFLCPNFPRGRSRGQQPYDGFKSLTVKSNLKEFRWLQTKQRRGQAKSEMY